MRKDITLEENVIRLVFQEDVQLDDIFFAIHRCADIDAQERRSFHRLYDARQVSDLKFKYENLPDISEMVERIKGSGLNHKVAFLVSTEEQLQFILAYQTFMIETELRIAVFFKEKVANDWLNID